MSGTSGTGPAKRDPAALVERAGRGDPRQDQHYLVDERVLDRLPGYLPDPVPARSGEGRPWGHLLEVGAGAGVLTDRLLSVADRVTGVERDTRLVEFLRREFAEERAAGRLEVVAGDALEVDLPEFDACVSNLPYGASSEIAFRLFPRGRPMVLTFQREFVERMVADPGTPEYGRLSVSARHYADVELAEVIPPSAFDPQPAVESAVAVCRPREPDYAVPDDEFFLRFVKALFTQRRKTVRNAVRNTTHISGIEDAAAVLEATDEETLSRRPGDLSPAEFAALARCASDVGGVAA
ncbi:MAG: 16S ribosomal RNA methyltransferase A [Halobacteriaceae archaeon]